MADATSAVDTDQSSAGTAAQQSAAQTTESQAGSGARGANAGAGVQGSAAGSQPEFIADIDSAESYTHNLAVVTEKIAADILAHNKALNSISEQIVSNQVALANLVNNNAAALSNLVNNQIAQDIAGLNAINKSERERTLRDGDTLDTVKLGFLSAQPFFQDAVEAVVAKVLAKQQAAKTA